MSYQNLLTERQAIALSELKRKDKNSRYAFSLMLPNDIAKITKTVNPRWGSVKEFTYLYIDPDGTVRTRI